MICIDPGIRGCGLAVFYRGELVRAQYVANIADSGDSLALRVASMASCVYHAQELVHVDTKDELITERPQIYAHGKGKGNPNDLIALAEIGAYAAALINPVRWIQVLPRQWKGTIDGDAMTDRIVGRLKNEEECAVISYKSGALDHNTYDAVGIGLWRLGRLGGNAKRRVYAR